MIKEVIVVEGKDDVAAVKKACQAEVIITNGLGITEETIKKIRVAQERCGVIVFTDPDYPGEKIRKIIDKAVPGCRHAFLKQNRDQDKKALVGVEYASPEEIREALARAHVSDCERKDIYEYRDLYQNGLLGHPGADKRRTEAGEMLGIGKTNAKQFLKRLNAYGITREEFQQTLKAIKE